MWVVVKLCPYLYGHPFSVATSHHCVGFLLLRDPIGRPGWWARNVPFVSAISQVICIRMPADSLATPTPCWARLRHLCPRHLRFAPHRSIVPRRFTTRKHGHDGMLYHWSVHSDGPRVRVQRCSVSCMTCPQLVSHLGLTCTYGRVQCCFFWFELHRYV